jgi:LmbE family N-acetylglucosaminyl deacetylase
VRPVYDQGALGLTQTVRRLNTSATVLMIGAHPDDEDTALLAYLARGENARTAYLSLTRGDGGQNAIGLELGESLGVIRTEELLQARRLDGAEQYFTRAYDYGFSKTLAEAKQKWDEDVVLCDVVRVIRDFRPLVVVSQFNGTPADGHGQHQYAGYISPLAVKAAADIGTCPSDGPAWAVKKFYVRHRGNTEPTLRINTGKYDPMLGRSYFEIAMQARSQHRSQEQGVPELKGEQISAVDLEGGTAKESDIFEGLDTSIKGIAATTGNPDENLAARLSRLQTIAAAAYQQYDIRSPEKIVSLLMDGYVLSDEAERSTRDPASKSFLGQKRSEFLEAIRLAAGIQIDAISDAETVVQGEEFPVNVRLFTPSPETVSVKSVSLVTRSGKTILPTQPPAESDPNPFRREKANYAAYFTASLNDGPDPTQPYWLESPRDGDLFKWQNAPGRTLPFQPPVLTARLAVTIDGRAVEMTVPVEYRYTDGVLGELRRDLNVVPTLTLDLDQQLLIVPTSKAVQTRRVVVSVVNNSAREQIGEVSVNVDGVSIPGWTLNRKPFSLARKGDKASLLFDIPIPQNITAGAYTLRAQASTMSKGAIDRTVYASKMNVIAYPHIRTHRFYTPSKARMQVFDLAVAPVRVGYIAGSGDRVADAIRQMGLAVNMLGENDLASSDLSRFDVIVVGIRAYQVRPDVVANNKRLLDFASNGGTLVVQYQLPSFAKQGVLPYPAQMGPRVADENAAVNMLQRDHPIFNSPNKITPDDFRGWVQERNLYNFSTFDPKYTGLLESHDAGEPANNGGLVVADIGKGKYIYCSYSMFRQLPAGVPGAYRLFANILGLSSKAK